MQYRKFGKLDWNTSILGFGCMRLPTKDNQPMSPNIDESEAIRMIRYGIDHGINYLDTAYPYHQGQGEVVLGKALKDGYRAKIKVATKSPTWFIKQSSDFDKFLDEQLQRLQVDHIEFYLLHALDKEKWENVVLKHDVLARAEAAVRAGKIGHLGFSFHDYYSAFEPIVDGYDWAFAQIQYNYMDTENQAGTKGLKYLAAKGIPAIVMEPVLGGRLATPPKRVRETLAQSATKRTPAEWALQWVWNHSEVALSLSGMSNMDQVKENLVSADRAKANSFSREDLRMIERVVKQYNEQAPIPCTQCSYCMPCPNDVDIPRNFKLYNDGVIHENMGISQGVYYRFVPENERAGACIQCKICEEKCPQKIPIAEWMPKVHEALGKK